jgi:cytoskeleton protein RodZ
LWYALSSSDRAAVSTPPALPSATSSEATTPPPVPVVSSLVAPVATPAVDNAALPQTIPTAPLTPSTTNAAGAEVYGATNKKTHLTIRAAQSSWILIADSDGKTVFDHVLKPGDTYKVPDTEGLTLTTGNGSGIILNLDGVDLPKLSVGYSHVMRNVPLDPDHLKSLPNNPD